ncbi:MAG TPA: antitoxin [Steroidobacteraceae bacterium]|jgi:plasmid stability protein
MAVVRVRNLSDETLRVLKMRAAAHGITTEAEIREILEDAARPKDRLKIGSALAALAQPLGGIDLDTKRTPP